MVKWSENFGDQNDDKFLSQYSKFDTKHRFDKEVIFSFSWSQIRKFYKVLRTGTLQFIHEAENYASWRMGCCQSAIKLRQASNAFKRLWVSQVLCQSGWSMCLKSLGIPKRFFWVNEDSAANGTSADIQKASTDYVDLVDYSDSTYWYFQGKLCYIHFVTWLRSTHWTQWTCELHLLVPRVWRCCGRKRLGGLI